MLQRLESVLVAVVMLLPATEADRPPQQPKSRCSHDPRHTPRPMSCCSASTPFLSAVSGRPATNRVAEGRSSRGESIAIA